MPNGRITLAVLASKIDDLKEDIGEVKTMQKEQQNVNEKQALKIQRNDDAIKGIKFTSGVIATIITIAVSVMALVIRGG